MSESRDAGRGSPAPGGWSDYEIVVLAGPGRGTAVPLPAGRVTLGSGDACGVRLADPSVAGAHAEIEPAPDGSLWIRDLTGRGLTAVNGRGVERERLEDGAFLRLGTMELCLRARHASTPHGTMVRGSGATGPRPAVTSPSESGPGGTVLKPSTPASGTGSAIQPPAGAVGAGEGEGGGTAMQYRPTDVPAALTAETAAGELAAPGGALAPGTVVAERYRIVAKLAAGGMGEVYRAEHVELGKPLALKVMRRELSATPDFVDRFKREAIAASRIGQQNIVDVADFGRTPDGRFYFVMEYLSGATLTRALRDGGAMPADRALRIMVQLCRALAAAHQQGIVHRDLKPENVMLLDRDGQRDFVKVLDFGVAKVADARGDAGRTAIGVVMGTPQYMSPEQAAGLPSDHRADVYSLGLILYEMLAGRPPFVVETPSLVMAAHIHQAPPPLDPPAGARPVSPTVRDLVARMLAKKPEHRPQSVAEVLAVVERCAGDAGETVPGAPSFPVSGAVAAVGPRTGPTVPVSGSGSWTGTGGEVDAARPRRQVAAIAGGLFAVIAATAGVFLVTRSGGGEVRPEPVSSAPPAAGGAPALVPAATQAVPPTPAATRRVKVSLVSTPTNVEVYQGDLLLGRTPIAIEWEPGRRGELRFVREGFEAATRAIAPHADLEVAVELARRPEKRPAVPKGKRRSKRLLDDPYAEPAEDLMDAPY